LLVLIPAHNEEAAIGKNLHALLTQTRVPDRIVVIADNCTDRTEEIARRYRGVTVMRTVGNTERKVGALNQGWLRWQAGYDYIAGVDADTVLAPDCLQHLEEELATPPGRRRDGRYTFEQNLGSSATARLLIRMQRLEFASWTADALRRNRKTYVLGGQATLFNAEAKMLGALLLVGLVAAGAVFGWLHAPLFVQQRTLTVGWGVLAVVTALQTLIMVFRIFRPTRGMQP
jgi:poly-beta-1,6-N-acetyl-D-glucosamine synthase